ncbi:CBS domain-containing protein [Pseudonocardia acaciae]|uniref:CBS domain-containing protein n=1 Tax=Pseudonocardia acaciae TaxID=551276 RepID=UPI000A04FA13|nr:CBS domain-containing protein [Pseudonocardia acaciae]
MTAGTTQQVGELMSARVFTTHPRCEAADAALVIGLSDVGALPVLDDGRLVGMFTEADLLRRQRATGRSDLLVEDVMVPVALVATPDGDPAELAEAMRRRQVRTVPVVDNGRLVGVITGNDLPARARPA